LSVYAQTAVETLTLTVILWTSARGRPLSARRVGAHHATNLVDAYRAERVTRLELLVMRNATVIQINIIGPANFS
jgi:hypothetical protein